jgi:hypothetical protein
VTTIVDDHERFLRVLFVNEFGQKLLQNLLRGSPLAVDRVEAVPRDFEVIQIFEDAFQSLDLEMC